MPDIVDTPVLGTGTNTPAVTAPADIPPAAAPLPTVATAPTTPIADPIATEVVAPVNAAPVEIPENWIELQWKQVVVLAKRISGTVELSFDDAKRVILDELDLRASPEGDDGLVEMTKDGESLRVNPVAVDAHKKVGWKLA